jgi:hypothetical protein
VVQLLTSTWIVTALQTLRRSPAKFIAEAGFTATVVRGAAMTLLVNYEGEHVQCDSDPADTHVVVSQRRGGGLRIQPTHDVIGAMTTAQDEGDANRRAAAIIDDRAVFTVLADYEPEDPRQADARHVRIAGFLALAFVVLVFLILALVI